MAGEPPGEASFATRLKIEPSLASGLPGRRLVWQVSCRRTNRSQELSGSDSGIETAPREDRMSNLAPLEPACASSGLPQCRSRATAARRALLTLTALGRTGWDDLTGDEPLHVGWSMLSLAARVRSVELNLTLIGADPSGSKERSPIPYGRAARCERPPLGARPSRSARISSSGRG